MQNLGIQPIDEWNRVPRWKTSSAVHQQKVIYCSDKLFVPCVMQLTQTSLQRMAAAEGQGKVCEVLDCTASPPNQSCVSTNSERWQCFLKLCCIANTCIFSLLSNAFINNTLCYILLRRGRSILYLEREYSTLYQITNSFLLKVGSSSLDTIKLRFRPEIHILLGIWAAQFLLSSIKTAGKKVKRIISMLALKLKIISGILCFCKVG